MFDALASFERPASAYDIAEKVSQDQGRRVAANSVYRILDLFVDANLASRVESANAYVANDHPDCLHDCIFLICDTCGQAKHIDDDRLAGKSARMAVRKKHEIERPSGARLSVVPPWPGQPHPESTPLSVLVPESMMSGQISDSLLRRIASGWGKGRADRKK